MSYSLSSFLFFFLLSQDSLTRSSFVSLYLSLPYYNQTLYLCFLLFLSFFYHLSLSLIFLFLTLYLSLIPLSFFLFSTPSISHVPLLFHSIYLFLKPLSYSFFSHSIPPSLFLSPHRGSISQIDIAKGSSGKRVAIKQKEILQGTTSSKCLK